MADSYRARKLVDLDRVEALEALEDFIGYEALEMAYILGIRPTTYYEFRRGKVNIPDYVLYSAQIHLERIRTLTESDPAAAERLVETWVAERIAPNKQRDAEHRRMLAAKRQEKKVKQAAGEG